MAEDFAFFSFFLFAFLEDIMLDDKPVANMLSFLKGSYHFFFQIYFTINCCTLLE